MSSAAARRPPASPPPERPDLETLRAKALAALDAIHRRAAETGFDKLTDEEIQAEIDAMRAERRGRERRGG